MENMDKTIGFIGLGAMGKYMVKNLVAAKCRTIIFDINREILKEYSEFENVKIADSVIQVGREAQVIITMLPNSPHVEAVTIGTDGMLDVLEAGDIIIDMSTISPSVSRKIAKVLKEKNVAFIDAPVSGGQKGARNGTLSIMVGGEREVFDEVLHILRFMGTTVNYVGESGSGQAVKLCNQVIVGMNIQAICEAFALGKAEGLDLNVLRDALSGGAANSWMLENLAPQMIADDASAGFRIALQLKDLQLALDESFELGVPMPGTSIATHLYLESKAHGELDNGNQAMYKVFKRLANQK